MNAFSPEVIERLGWLLVHSVWQFAVVAIVAAMIVAVLRRHSAASRYAVLVAAMLLMVAVPCATWMIQASGWASALRVDAVETDWRATVVSTEEVNSQAMSMPYGRHFTTEPAVLDSQPLPEFDAVEQTRRADAQPLAESITELLRPWFSWIVGGWLIGVLLCSLRPLLGWRMLRRLRQIGISPPSDEVLAAFVRISQRLGVRRAVQVFHSTLATGPLVVGYLKPVVLLPVSLVTSIPMPQLEAILAHELAHIRRHDFIINLAQTLMETLFFYHPAIWWLSRRIRIEREHCCDDLVVKLFNNGVDYGRALLAIEQLQSQGTVLALGATDGSLLRRIRRITGATSHQSRFFPWLATAIALSVVCGMWIAGQELIYGASNEVSNDSDSSVEEAEVPADESKESIDGLPEFLIIRQHETCIVELGFPARATNGFSSDIVSMQLIRGPGRYQIQGQSVGFAMLSFGSRPPETLRVPDPEYLIPVYVAAVDDVSNPSRGDRVYRITPANRAPDSTHVSNNSSTITLLAGVVEKLEFPWLVSNTKSSAEDIIQYEVVKSRHRLNVKGISPGKTTLRVSNASLADRQECQIEIEVLPLTRENILAVFGKSKKIEAKLSDGMSIELVGISTPPIELTLNDKREWWKGDGTKMEVSPIPRSSISVGASESDGREFVVRAANLAGQIPMDVTLKERFKDGQPHKPEGNGWSQSSTHSGPIDENQKDEFQVTSEYVAGPVGDADSATLEVRVGSGVAAEMLFDVKGQRSNGDSKDEVWQLAAVKKMAERVEVLRTGPHEAGFAIWTKPFSSTTDEGSLDVTLIDAAGQRHNRFTSGSDGNEAFHVFEIKPEEIDKFVVCLRPYQYVATFENVSLKPGVKSEVKVTVASLLAEKTPVVDIPASSDDRTDGERASETPFGSQSNADIFPIQTDNDPSQISLRGLILNARNESIPNATVCVVIVDADDEKHRVSKVVKSNNDGLFQIIVPKEWATQFGRRREIWAAAEGHQIEVAQLPPLDADSKLWDQQQCTLKLADASDYGVQIVGNAWADVEKMSLVTPHEYVIRTEKNGTGITAFIGRVPRELAAIVGAKTDDQGDIKLPCVSPKRLQSLQVESKALGIQLLSPREERTAELRTKIGMKIVGRVEGRIRVSGGQMLDGIRIHANFNPVNTSGEHSLQHVIVAPDPDGKFSFAMTQGKVDIWAEMPPNSPWFLRHQRHVLIEQNETVTIDMQSEKPVRVSGQVVSQEDQTPIAGLGILLRSPDGSGYETTVTDTEGKFSARVLSGGVEMFTDGKWTIPRESKSSINVPANDDEYVLPTLKAIPIDVNP